MSAASYSKRTDLDPRIFTENVLALLDRSEAIKDEAEQKTLRKIYRDKELEEDRAFLEYNARVSKARQAAQVKESLQPFSAEVASNYEYINAMLGIQAGGAKAAQQNTKQQPTQMSRVAAAQEDIGFEVDTDFAMEFNGGKPMKSPPAAPSVDRTALAIEMLTRGGGDLDLDEFEEGDASLNQDPSWSAKTPSAAIGRRTVAVSKQSPGPADPLKTAAGEHIRALLAPPPQTATYAHEIAHLFNMLDSNNIILIATEEIPKLTEGPPEYKNTLVMLSPTNGYRLRRHLETPVGEPNIVYTSHGWTVRRELLSAILQGRVDFEHIARMHVSLEQTYCDLKRHEALLKKKDQELARTKTTCESLVRSTENLVAKSRLRRALLVQLAVALRSAHQEADTKHQAETTKHRGAVLADFIMRHDSHAARDEELAVGGLGLSLKSASQYNTTFSGFDELQRALHAYDEIRSKAHAQDTSHIMNAWSEGNSMGFAPPPALDFSLLSPTAAGYSNPSLAAPAPTSPMNEVAAILATSSQAHEALLRSLHKKVEMAQRRRNFERRMEHMERLALEGEDVQSSVNTLFRFGETGFARVRDLLNSIPASVLQNAARAGGSLHHIPLSYEGQTVICPCCKFDFDPSKPAGFYREMILQRQKKAREAMAAKAPPPSVNASQLHGEGKGGGGKGSKRVVAGNDRGRGESSEDQMYVVMALQESLDDMQKQNKALDDKVAELDAGLEVANLNALAAQQRAQTLQEEFTKVTEELRAKASAAQTALHDVTKAKDAAEHTAKQLKIKLANMEKAAEQAMEELELIHASDRRVADLVSMRAMEKGVADSRTSWEEIAKSYYRKYEEVAKQVRRLGGEVLETFDVYCGPDTVPIRTTSKQIQYDVEDVGLKVPKFEDASINAVAAVVHRESQRTPRPGGGKPVHVETQTVGVHVINHALLNSEKQEAQQQDWRTKQGDDVQTVLMRRDIYNLLLKSSDHSDMMRDYIRELERKDKEEQERHAKEIAEAAKAAEREIKALKKDLEAKREALEKRDKEAEDRHARKMSELLEAAGRARRDALDQKDREEQDRRQRELDALALKSQREMDALRDSMKGMPPTLPPRLASPPTETKPPTSPPTSDSGVSIPFDQMYQRPTGVGRSVIRRINAFTTVELEELESAVRRELESQYAAFTIPLPMLLALLVTAKSDVKKLIADQEQRGKQREDRINQAIHVSRVLLGGDLGVGNDAPSWYQQSPSAFPRRASVAETPVHDHHSQPRSYRVLEVKEFPMLEPSQRDPVTGQYVKDFTLHHAAFTSSRALKSPQVRRGSPSRSFEGMLMISAHGGSSYLLLDRDDVDDDEEEAPEPIDYEHRKHHAFETVPQRVAKLSVDGSQLPPRNDAGGHRTFIPTTATLKAKQVEALRRQQDEIAYVQTKTRAEPSLANILGRPPREGPTRMRPLDPREFEGEDIGFGISSYARPQPPLAPIAPRHVVSTSPQPPVLKSIAEVLYPTSHSAEPIVPSSSKLTIGKRQPPRGTLTPLP